VVPKRQGSGPPPQRPAPDTCSTSRCQAASPPQSSEDGQDSPKRSTAEFWATYHRYVAGDHGGPPDDPGNYWCYGPLSVPLADFELPAELVELWQRTADAYSDYVGLVAVFDELDTAHWTRWHALRKALPGVRHDLLRRLLDALDGVDTPTLVDLCGHQSGVSA
jgi:hypothetical protein